MSQGRLQVFSAPTARKGQDVAAVFAEAVANHQAGRLAEAQAGYKRVLKKRPNHFQSLHLLGISEHEAGNSEAAARSLWRALLVDPQSASAHSDLSIVLIALRRLDEALASCDKAIALKADFANAHYNRGIVLTALLRFADAVECFDRAIAIDPQHADALNNRGIALHELGRFADAIASYDAVITLKPGYVDAFANRGAALKELRQAEAAIADFDRALTLAPNHAGAWSNRGEVLFILGRVDEARANHEKALSINQNLPGAWLGLANIFMRARRVTEALAACKRALAIKPDSTQALTMLGQITASQGDAEAAVACFDRALAIKPDDEVALSNKIFSLDFTVDGDFARHQDARAEWWRQIGSRFSAQRPSHHEHDRDPARRIVLGYVSAEFMHRSAAFSFLPILENHDKTRFEVICYSGARTDDAVTASFRKVADRWRDVSQWTDNQLAASILADKVDILIDLGGHSGENRLSVFARKPAPVQVSAWGHSTGTGLPTIDYLFSDPVAIPAAARHLFAEQVYDLPCLMIVEPPTAGLRCPEPPVTSNGYLTYGVLNRVSKISDDAIKVWARILRSDVTSRLLIKDRLVDDSSIQRLLLERFAGHEIGPDRISFLGSTSRPDHLAAYKYVDICLDPFPQGGGVSTWEALHMGVPVVAKLGAGVTSRVAGAILSSVDLPDWVAADDDEYVKIALGSTPDRLKTIRSQLPSLIERRCGPAEYTRAVEEAYRTMWQKFCSGLQG
jgi:predicted O-linked N-acetylglucosamine transferase (SPINDLY family)